MGTPAARTPVAVPSVIDGKPATATHFSLEGNKSKAQPVAPFVVPEDTKWGKSYVAAQAKEDSQVNKSQKAVITYVLDGDTVDATRKDKSSLRCRLDTFDAPESAQAFGKESKKSLQQMVADKEVTLTITQAPLVDPSIKKTGANNYGRALCRISVEGKDISAATVSAGMAWAYRRFVDGQPVLPGLDSVEESARNKKVGLWADPMPENPYDFRKRNKKWK